MPPKRSPSTKRRTPTKPGTPVPARTPSAAGSARPGTAGTADEDIPLPAQVRLERALLEASDLGHTTVVRNILRKIPLVIDTNAVDNVGQTALAKAAKGGHQEIVDLLLQMEGTKVDVCDPVGTTPLHLAAARGYTNIIKLLVIAGASLECKTASGCRAIEFVSYGSEAWKVLKRAAAGVMPEVHYMPDVPVIPLYAIARGEKKKKKKKKGKKGAKKKGAKKKKK